MVALWSAVFDQWAAARRLSDIRGGRKVLGLSTVSPLNMKGGQQEEEADPEQQ